MQVKKIELPKETDLGKYGLPRPMLSTPNPPAIIFDVGQSELRAFYEAVAKAAYLHSFVPHPASSKYAGCPQAPTVEDIVQTDGSVRVNFIGGGTGRQADVRLDIIKNETPDSIEFKLNQSTYSGHQRRNPEKFAETVEKIMRGEAIPLEFITG